MPSLTLDDVTLADKYDLAKPRAYLNGTQAIVRLALTQAGCDRADGLSTAGFVSGYRGSPLGGVDLAFERAARETAAAGVRFVPGVNEDLAATAVLGTQQINLFEPALHEGVFALWYGKGPGVDRSGDAFRHGNLAGSAPRGGVLLLAGDDHVCKSSTTSHQSEFALMDAMIPVLAPASLAEIGPLGLYGWSLSRFSGCWTSLKLVADVVDSSGSVAFAGGGARFRRPSDFEPPPGGLGIRWPDTPQEQERRLHNWKLPAVLAFARANPVDGVVLGAPKGRLGIVATGKAYVDTRQALNDLGLDAAAAERLGVALYKVGMVWPLEPEGISRFAGGFDQILVIEEKRSLIEAQLKDILYNAPEDRRPRVVGKNGAGGFGALPAHDDLNAERIADAILARMSDWPEAAALRGRLAARPSATEALIERTPYFCSGCPHSTSTRVPEGSRAMAGIGCHWMSQAMDRDTATYTHMGGEGANWIGQAPFVATPHIFQNMGDGTFFHSGLLAIRATVAAKVTMTYKILFNDAVAMTGGQSHDGALDAARITRMVRAEGVSRIAVVADDPSKYGDAKGFANGVTLHPREALDGVQRELRQVPGVSVLVYDQVCAATKRRRRKQAVERRAFINELVCEGCGDCSAKSNCLSVTPVDTPFGRKRRIDQTSCNTDLSCVTGFCPSFVTVEGATLRKLPPPTAIFADLPEPPSPALSEPFNVLITGVGGTGVVTIGAILAMAGHLEGKGASTLDMTGMAQKGGAVTTHLRLAPSPERLHATRLPAGSADLLLGCDLVTAASKAALSALGHGRTRAVLNVHEAITAQFIRHRDFRMPRRALVERLTNAIGEQAVATVDATALTTARLGDAMGTNLFMVGFAWQQGWLPLGRAAIEGAIELNGAAVEMNRQAFALGRLAAAGSPDSAPSMAGLEFRAVDEGLPSRMARWRRFLVDYQDRRWANRWEEAVGMVAAAERELLGHEGVLTEIAARNLFRLMSYKDEYEVARLYASSAFRSQLETTFEPGARLTVHLAPPLLAGRDAQTGEPRKLRFGGWVFPAFRLLAALRWLRGTTIDPFGVAGERRLERRLIADYRRTLELVSSMLTRDNHAPACVLCDAPSDIRGFGPVKARSIAEALPRWRALEAAFRGDH
jgi:indolepyruvate ferredoxin oxidoreductase